MPEPERSCIGCGAKRPKRALHRLVLESAGQPKVDDAQVLPGRGAYLCGAGCLTAAMKRKALTRAFRGQLKTMDLDDLAIQLQAARPPR